jgi:transcriptional regulator NrdR family protein
MKIIKHSGDIVDFDPEKLRKSLVKSGAGELIVEDILHKIRKEIYDGITTKKFINAFALLKKEASMRCAI